MSLPAQLEPLLALAGAGALFGLVLWALARTGFDPRAVAARKRFDDAFGDGEARGALQAGSNWLKALGNRLIDLGRIADSDEVRRLLARAGWKRRNDVAIFYALQALLPLLTGIIASHTFIVGGIDAADWSVLGVACIATYLLPKRILAQIAAARQRRVAEQTPVLVYLLRVLLETGLSVEQALRSLVADTRELLPDLAFELDYLLSQLDAGADIAVAMPAMADAMDVPALSDLTILLEQTWRMGGNVLKSLAELSGLIEDRARTELKEKVSKLSAKMTVVMMLFLFPALMVILAAPGFISIVRGLQHVAG